MITGEGVCEVAKGTASCSIWRSPKCTEVSYWCSSERLLIQSERSHWSFHQAVLLYDKASIFLSPPISISIMHIGAFSFPPVVYLYRFVSTFSVFGIFSFQSVIRTHCSYITCLSHNGVSLITPPVVVFILPSSVA